MTDGTYESKMIKTLVDEPDISPVAPHGIPKPPWFLINFHLKMKINGKHIPTVWWGLRFLRWIFHDVSIFQDDIPRIERSRERSHPSGWSVIGLPTAVLSSATGVRLWASVWFRNHMYICTWTHTVYIYTYNYMYVYMAIYTLYIYAHV